jgi:hypothetical protein
LKDDAGGYRLRFAPRAIRAKVVAIVRVLIAE